MQDHSTTDAPGQPDSSTLRYGSVCSGIEAASVAWEPMGWQASFVSDIDPFARAVLRHRLPKVPLHGDFTTIEDGDYEPIDVLVGGTPCQSFSVAGLRGGMADDRGNLALEYCRLAKRLRPRWLVWENVPGVLSSNGGRDFGAFVGALVKLGYGVSWRVLDAQYVRVDGFPRAVAQRRRRVFVVGHSGGAWQRAAAVLHERAGLSWHPAPCRGSREGAAGKAACGVRSDGASHTLVSDGYDASEDGSGRGTPIISAGLTANSVAIRGRDGGATVEIGGPVSHALRASSGGEDKPHVAVTLDVARCLTASMQRYDADTETFVSFDSAQITSPTHRRRLNVVAGALAATSRESVLGFHNRQDPVLGAIMPSIGAKDNGMGVLSSVVRRLTPRECERLQGFPDDWTLVPYRGGLSTDSPRYRAIGNSMAVNVMRWIGRRIEAVEAIP